MISAIFEPKRRFPLKSVATTYTFATAASPQSTGGSSTFYDLGWAYPLKVTTTLDSGQATATSYQYNSGGYYDLQPVCTVNYPNTYSCSTTSSTPVQFPFGKVTSKTTTDYSGATMQTVSTQYLYQQNSSYYAANFLDLIASQTTLNGSGSKVAATTLGYDENNGSPQGIFGHQTSVNRWLNTTGINITSKKIYNSQDMLTQSIDALSNTTKYTYDSTGAFISQVQRPDTVTNGVTTHHISNYTYDTVSGRPLKYSDEDQQQTTYSYDSMGRATTINYPDGGKTILSYNDAPYNSSTPSPSVTTTRAMTSSANVTSLVAFDGLGHPVRSVLTSDPDCASGDRTDTTYDGLGRVYTVSNPYCTTSDPTYGLTTFAYDALGRTTQVAHPDGSTVLTTYTGRATQVQDEGNGTRRVSRVSQMDGLGHLVSVCEVSSITLPVGGAATPSACGQDIAATGFLTTYGYDALDNLASVAQPGLNPRSFTYDSFSRLLSASNPESGTISYTYDANGNVSTKTDARNITATYVYDALNRLTQKSYSDGTPTATLNYDQNSAYGVTLVNTIGRISSEITASPNPTGKIFSYDQLGRVKINSQCTPQNCAANTAFPVTYTYDLLGDMLTSTNGAGVTSTYAVNTAARLSSLTSSLSDPNHPGTPFSSAHYNAAGSLLSASLGNGISESRTYDPRLRLASITDGSLYSLTIPATGGYAPNGDILTANDSVNGNWTYTYDDFNRLLSANATGQAYTYDYDRYGNRWHQNGPHSSQLGFDANDHITAVTGLGYDVAGNLTSDGTGPGTHTYFYDAENRIIQVDGTLGNCSTAAACYVYNAEGQRVRKTTGSTSVDYLYDLAGNQITELSSSGSWNRGEVYAGSRHLATYANSTTYFIHADWLGTERARSTATGGSYETCASLPFGDALTCSGGDPSPMHFTGKERDSESGLDNFGARYDSSSMGRFMSPDPLYIEAHRLADPQRLNLYAYVRNNPVNLTDPTGLDVALKCDTRENCTKAVNDFNNRKNAQFKVELGKDGKLHVVKGSVAKNLGKSEGALLGAINDTQNHATINVSGNTGQSEFGVHDSRGVNSVDLENLSKLDAPSNAGGLNSGDVLAHEAMDAYYSLSMGAAAADWAAADLFPGLLMPTNVQIDRTSGVLFGQTSDQMIAISTGSNGTGTERVTIRYITPIPFQTLNARQIQGAERAAGSRVTEVTFVPPKQ